MKRATAGLALIALVMSATGNRIYAHQDNPVSVSDRIEKLSRKFTADAMEFHSEIKGFEAYRGEESVLLIDIADSQRSSAFSVNDNLHAAFVELTLFKSMEPATQTRTKAYLLSEIR